jgi:RNA polymerase-binding transcription factor DksA
MEQYAKIRDELTARRTLVGSRLRDIARDAAQRGYSCGPEGASDLATNPILENHLRPRVEELAKLESALRRLERREFDCCILCGGRIAADRLELLPLSSTCESCSKSYPVEYAEDLRIEHSGLRMALQTLLTTLARIDAILLEGSSAEVEVGAAVVLYRSLHRELPEHFSREEEDGYFAAALDRAPHFHRRTMILLHQHAVFRRSLDRMHLSFLDAERNPSHFGGIKEAFEKFANDLLIHEADENALLEEAFLEDIGLSG